jgi:hypothetical protein
MFSTDLFNGIVCAYQFLIGAARCSTTTGNKLMKPFSMCLAAALSAAALSAPATAALSYATFAYSNSNPVTITLNGTTTLTATNTGWYRGDGFHNAFNINYIAGICGSSDYCKGNDSITRDYFAFDLSSIVGPVTSATISALQNPSPNTGYISTAPSITYTNYDVSTSFGSLVASQNNAVGTYADLGSGTVYAVTTILASSNGSVINISLNSAGLAALNGDIGGVFTLGGSVDQAVSGTPEPASWAMLVVGFGLIGVIARRRNTVVVA